MKYVMTLCLACCCALLLNTSFAAIYQSVDAAGNVTYSDAPHNKKTTEVTLPPSNAYRAPTPVSATLPAETATAPATDNASPAEHKEYSRLEITRPDNEQTIQNQPTISVTVAVEPELQKGDTLRLLVDGTPVATQTDTSFSIAILDRGTHTLQAELVDAQGNNILQSKSIIIYVQRAHT